MERHGACSVADKGNRRASVCSEAAEVLQLSGTGTAAQGMHSCSSECEVLRHEAYRKAAQGRKEWWHKACTITAHGLELAVHGACSIAVQNLLGTLFWNAIGSKRLEQKSMSLTEQQHWMAFSLWLLAVQPLGSEDILPVGIELKHGNEHERHLESLKWHR